MKRPDFSVRFWGVRGSLPTGGPETARYGGNTPCVEVRCGSELIIFDAGSGIRALGDDLRAKHKGPLKATIFFSHLHWDHVQGFPFFTPAYRKENEFTLIAENRNGLSLKDALKGMMSYPYFPVPLEAMSCKFDFRQFQPGETLTIGQAVIKTFPTRHPQAATAYRIEYGGKSVLYATDTEHPENGHQDPNLLAAAQNVNCLIYDATFTEKEYTGKKDGMPRIGWGHSTWEKAVELAKATATKRLILFHHDPARTDRELAALEKSIRRKFRAATAAREGLVLKI